MFYLSSTFSIQMLSDTASSTVQVRPLSVQEAVEMSTRVNKNAVNPRHESTAALSGCLTSLPAEGGFVKLVSGDEILVILPPRQFMSRSGTEIVISDLEECQFFLVCVD